MTLDITTVHDGATATLALRGELDLATQADLIAALDAATTDGVLEVLVDLRDLAFLDSTGITALVVHAGKLRERGGRLRITGAAGMPRRALQITGVYDLLTGNEDVTT